MGKIEGAGDGGLLEPPLSMRRRAYRRVWGAFTRSAAVRRSRRVWGYASNVTTLQTDTMGTVTVAIPTLMQLQNISSNASGGVPSGWGVSERSAATFEIDKIGADTGPPRRGPLRAIERNCRGAKRLRDSNPSYRRLLLVFLLVLEPSGGISGGLKDWCAAGHRQDGLKNCFESLPVNQVQKLQ